MTPCRNIVVEDHDGDRDRTRLLSERECIAMRLAAEGYSMGETGEIMRISPRTVENHRASAIRKLKARNIVQAAVMVDRALSRQ